MTNEQIDAYGNWMHDVRGVLERTMGIKERKAYELIGRYPTMLLLTFTQGRTAEHAASLIGSRKVVK